MLQRSLILKRVKLIIKLLTLSIVCHEYFAGRSKFLLGLLKNSLELKKPRRNLRRYLAQLGNYIVYAESSLIGTVCFDNIGG